VKLRDLADRLGCRLEGDGDVEIDRVAAIDSAGPGDLTFLANPKYTHALARTRASAVILAEDAPAAPCAMLRTAEPYVTLARALRAVNPPDRPAPGIHPSALIEEGAEVAPDACIGPFVHVGRDARIGARSILHGFSEVGSGARIGADCVVHTHVAIRERVTLGDRVVVQNGAVIGADGFGFATTAAGVHEKIPQVGVVVIEDDVEIGANSAVDRPAVGETRVGAGTKIDNLVQVAHGVRIGRNVFLAAQVGIAGSTTVGDGVVLAGQVGVAGHLAIGDRVRATAQTGISHSIPAGALVSGYPAFDNREWLKATAVFQRLPDVRRTLQDLDRRLSALEARPAGDPRGASETRDAPEDEAGPR
jgi:UDP-3-O-[3-hydroxymyristoyl] glucosamine N-acyltransferase